MNCPVCGRDVTGKKFCPICGRPVEQPPATSEQMPVEAPTPRSEVQIEHTQPPVSNPAPQPAKAPATAPKPKPTPVKVSPRPVSEKPSGKVVMVVICILVAVAIVLAGVLVFLSVYNSGGEDAPIDTPKTEETDNKPDDTEIPEEPEFPRKSSFDSGYVYLNMEEVRSSEEADDSEAFEMQDVVTNFNNSWVEYVNTGDTSVFSYLRANTQAYRYAVAYGAKDIHEEYILMEVNDVRKYGDSYYVWTHEIIEETSTVDSTDVKRFEYHWVYKVSYSNGGYYIENYISDPAYK